MRLTLEGHDKRYLAETLALLFFPAAGFRQDREDGLSATLRYDAAHHRGESIVAAHGRSASAFEQGLDHEDPADLLARSFYRAGQELTGITPPWGTLTGIRPAKKVAQLLRQGLTPRQTTEELRRTCYVSPHKTDLCVAVLEGERVALSKLDPKAISLYIGIPFCPSRCSYCSFVSFTTEREGRLIPDYLRTLQRDLENTLAGLGRLGLSVQTVYIGGGTPTTLSAEQLTELMGTVSALLPVERLLEYTVEAGRPDTITPVKLEAIVTGGARRISVNPQTTHDDTLRLVGRGHTAAQFFEAYALAAEIGIPSINVDLIAGLPGETPAIFDRSLREVAALRPANLTVHTLSLKRAARLQYADLERSRAGAEGIAEMLQTAQREVFAGGWRPYYLYRQRNTLGNLENVGYAQPGTECLYNTYIMGEYQSIVAVGAGAVSKVVGLSGARIARVFSHKHVTEYLRDEEKRKNNQQALCSLLQARVQGAGS